MGAHLEDGLGAVEAPAGAGDVHAVLEQSRNREWDRDTMHLGVKMQRWASPAT